MRRLVYRAAPPATDVVAAIARIKAWMRTALALGPDVALSVTEMACGEPGCPPRETVVLVMPAGARAMKYSVHKALAEVVEDDIRACASVPPQIL